MSWRTSLKSERSNDEIKEESKTAPQKNLHLKENNKSTVKL